MRRLSIALLAVRFIAFSADMPSSPRHPVTDVYHGVSVTDDYRWLENVGSPEVQTWVAQQNAYTNSVLESSKKRSSIRQQWTELFGNRPTSYSSVVPRAGKLFAMKRERSKQQPSLVVLNFTGSRDESVVLDPAVADKTGSTAIDWFTPSTSGRYVAVSLSKKGSEQGDLHLYETSSGKELTADLTLRVQNGTAGGSACWNADDTGFYYTRYPAPGERPVTDLAFYQQIYFHQLGGPASKDRYELGREFPRIGETVLEASKDGKRVFATVANGDGGEYLHFLHTEEGGWHQVTTYSDQVTDGHFGRDGSLFLLTKKNAPLGRLIHLPKSKTSAAEAEQVVGESDASIEIFRVGEKTIYIGYLAGGPSEIRMTSLEGRQLGRVPLEGVVAADSFKITGSDDLLFVQRGYVKASSWQTYSAETHAMKEFAPFAATGVFDFSDAEVVRDFAISKDGTRVPLNIIRKKGTTLSGQNPVLLTGYGGYGISETPNAGPMTRMLLDHGFVYVTTNLRGGAEYGQKWHDEGRLTRKQNVFDDFYACAKYLVDHNYTSPEKLGIMGGSNGGLLMGAELIQHPQMFRVVLAFVGIYDMLRVELSPNGAFNVTEFGTVKEQDQFKALFAYSPYHHVMNGTKYPAAIFLTGDNDPRVDPSNSRKMVARLQTAGTAKGPVLLRTSSGAGHGMGSSLNEMIEQYTDAVTFLFQQLGL